MIYGVWNSFSHSVGNVIIPTDFQIFQRGRYTTNQDITRYNSSMLVGWHLEKSDHKLFVFCMDIGMGQTVSKLKLWQSQRYDTPIICQSYVLKSKSYYFQINYPYATHGAGIWIPTFTTKSPSYVGFYIPAPWVAYGLKDMGPQTSAKLGGSSHRSKLRRYWRY